MVIGIVGSRRRNTRKDFNLLVEKLDEVIGETPLDEVVFVSGGCPLGGDKFADDLAKEFGLTIITHHPYWKKYGKTAGLRRNTKIARDCDFLIALVASDRKGGAEDTIRKAIKLGKEVILI